MDQDLLGRLMRIAIAALVLAGAIFIGLFLFLGLRENALLGAALCCNLLAGLFYCVRESGRK